MNLWKTALLMVLSLLLSAAAAGCNSSSEPPRFATTNETGNAVNNILNGGYAAMQGEWIFWADPQNNHHIFAMTDQGADKQVMVKQVMVKQPAAYINVIGDQLFYQNRQDGSRLYCTTIGAKDTQALTDDAALLVQARSDWIYFVDRGQLLNRIRHDGSDREILSAIRVHSYAVTDSFVYFVEPFGRVMHIYDIEKRQLDKPVKLPRIAVKAYYTESAMVYMSDEEQAVYEIRYDDPTPIKWVDRVGELMYADEQTIYYSNEQMYALNRATGDAQALHGNAAFHELHLLAGRLFYKDHPRPGFGEWVEYNAEQSERP